MPSESRRTDRRAMGTGIWLQASFFNHACSANSYRSFIANMMIVRAVQDIAEGEEVTFAYCNPALPFSMRQRRLKQGWQFICKCDLCLTESEWEESASALSGDLLSDLEAFLASHPSFTDMGPEDLDRLHDLMRSLDGGYRSVADIHEPCLPLVKPLLALTQTAAKHRKFKEAQNYALRLLGSLGLYVRVEHKSRVVFHSTFALTCELAIEGLIHLSHACAHLEENDIYKQVRRETNAQCYNVFGWEECFDYIYTTIGDTFWKPEEPFVTDD